MHRFALVLLAACGADVAPTPVTPRAPPPQPRVAAPRAVDQCTRACDRQASCLPSSYRDHDPSACIADCRTYLVTHDPVDPEATPRRYADCLAKLSCSEIERSTVMDSGRAGDCYSRAISIGR
jgi:hypothetical protein